MIIGWIIGAVVLILLIYVAAAYNRFVNLRNGIESTLNQITVALKKRLDMIAQVVDATKGQMKFEKSTLTEITKLRGQAIDKMSPADAAKLATASSRLAGAIAVQVEAYPKLSSSDNVRQLIDAIQSAEQEIAQLRYTYNNTIQEYNTKTQTFPSAMIASMFGFVKSSYLQMPESAAELNKRPDTKL